MNENEALSASNEARDKVKQNMYYILIGIISFISVAFLPMVGSTVGLGWKLPDTPTGWVVWAISRLIIATINVLIFYSFMEQAKLNVAKDPHYIEATEILLKAKKADHTPRSPRKWQALQYGKRGTKIFISSALSVVALGQAILSFDWVSMLAFIFTIAMGIVFGVLQMKKAEAYWTDEFYRYALMIKEEEAKKPEEIVNDNN